MAKDAAVRTTAQEANGTVARREKEANASKPQGSGRAGDRSSHDRGMVAQGISM